MSVRITCPSCDMSYAVADEQRGETIRCKYCKYALTVPDAEEEHVTEARSKPAPRRAVRADDDEERPAARRDRQREYDDEHDEEAEAPAKSRSSMLPILLLVGGGVAVVGMLGLTAIGVLAWLFMGVHDDMQPVAVANPLIVAPPPVGGPPVIPNGPPVIPNGPADIPPGLAEVPVVAPPPLDRPVGPGQIDAATRDRVKAATVYLHVTMPNGMRASGSGFFAIEPGIVVTNAHVLGMLQAQSKPPADVAVVVHSGEPGEKTLRGTVLGADRETDLAVVRVNDPGVPAPLPVHTAATLEPLQEVYFYGYPLGKALGKEVSINSAKVSSLRRNADGALAQVQLTGDMQPGNSGGPVVDQQGRVVGIAVAIVRNTRINFAVPADKIKPILDGRIDESSFGDPFLVDNVIKLPVKLRCLDPLRRVKALRLDVWTGPKGAPRPPASEPPGPMPGDGPRQTVALDYQNGTATADVPLPSAPPGQVYWFQPVVVDGAGATRWYAAAPHDATPPLQRTAAELRLKIDEVSQRTVQVKDTLRMTFRQGKKEFSEALHLETSLLETLCPIGKSANLGLSVGPNRFAEEELFGKQNPLNPGYSQRVRKLKPAPNFIIGDTGRMLVRNRDPELNPKLPPEDRDHLDMMYHRICEAFQQTLLVLPNRQVAPLEQFRAVVPTLIGRGKNKKQVDLHLTCTYLGSRLTEGRHEAVINLDGTIHLFEKGRGTRKESLGNVIGRAVLDLDHGFFSLIALRLWTELDLESDLQMVRSETIRLTRVPGNPDGIPETAPRPPAGTVFPPNPMPQPKPPVHPNPNPTPPVNPKPEVKPPPRPKGDVVVADVKGALTKNDFLNARNRKHKTHTVKMEAGVTYVIELKPVQLKADLIAINPFLHLLDPAGKEVAKDDDGGGGKNARISYTAPAAGTYRVVVTTMTGIQLGRYHLMVTAKY